MSLKILTGCTRPRAVGMCWSSTAVCHRNFCERCGKFYGLDHILHTEGVPRCDCGGIIKPDVVLYEEGLNEDTLHAAVRAISEADLMMIGGTSLNVWPAAGLINYYRGTGWC